jgi:hypothetical protein
MYKSFYLVAVLLLLLSSCGNNPVEKEPLDANVAYYNSIKHLTGLGFQPALKEADSVQVLFYDDPDGDAKRYTRYYKWFPSHDSNVVNPLKQAADKHFERLEKIKDCRSEGKIHFFKGDNPTQTFYFSNRGDSCNHLFFIADGWFYYMPMDSSSASFLKELKSQAVVPPSDMQP